MNSSQALWVPFVKCTVAIQDVTVNHGLCKMLTAKLVLWWVTNECHWVKAMPGIQTISGESRAALWGREKHLHMSHWTRLHVWTPSCLFLPLACYKKQYYIAVYVARFSPIAKWFIWVWGMETAQCDTVQSDVFVFFQKPSTGCALNAPQ